MNVHCPVTAASNLKGPAILLALLVAALWAPASWATAAPSDPATTADKPSWGLAASGGLLGGLGERSTFGVEASLWLGKLAPTRAVGLDAGWNTKALYAELQVAMSLWYAHDGSLEVGLGAGPLYDRAIGRRWGGQATTWIAFIPCPIFPYARIEMIGTEGPALSVGLMIKVLGAFYGHGRRASVGRPATIGRSD